MIKTILTGATALFFALPAFAEIEVSDAYARSASPMAKTGAAFMILRNTGAEDDRLVDVSSDIAAKVELHTHEENAEGVMRMIHVEEGFDLPAGGETVLQRGGKHVMMMGLNEPLDEGKTVSITLTFEKAGDMVVDVPVDLERQDHGGMDKGKSR
ncbi:copper chaperone PCu(A)C [Marivita sp. GX14005]|uniref:copper chaperone PCu(A)C n=1 Tax=Marivita sp. GX14005 TaxID=2942276 RepID=UPI002018C0AA|nr:copper chaperone PCu(A)C [Marivita sp. GX14005]MCL3880953.1 copper chaperone PCu(A)C [Marivita sp. GX14005]